MRFLFATRLLILFALLAPSGLTSAHAQSVGEACIEALAAEGIRWDGLEMEPFSWDGLPFNLEPIGTDSITLCRADGPPELLPLTQFIGCVIVGELVTYVDSRLACGAYRDIRRDGDDVVLWIARNNVATNNVGRLRWNGASFDPVEPYLACWDDPLTPIQDSRVCDRR